MLAAADESANGLDVPSTNSRWTITVLSSIALLMVHGCRCYDFLDELPFTVKVIIGKMAVKTVRCHSLDHHLDQRCRLVRRPANGPNVILPSSGNAMSAAKLVVMPLISDLARPLAESAGAVERLSLHASR